MRVLVLCIVSGLLSLTPALYAQSAGEIQFNRDVLPILAENCFACHGFDKHGRQAELRLDTFAGATEQRDGVAAVVPHHADQSGLVARILSTDPDQVMPPPDSEKVLTAEQKDTLTRWINSGATYDKHWSFISPVRPEPPLVAGVAHPIDRFVHQALTEAQLTPAPRADNATLIRRVSLDLTGLPPLPAEVDAFVAAAALDQEAAYRELVEQLLASPHYGERWGRWWLDQARYADSNGYSIDSPRQIWKYRDWVISAFNADMPFDQFTLEQLAGDLLPNASDSQKIATGFHRNTQINQEGGIDKEQFRIDSVFDRVATTGTVWLGLTIGCAQCHDHKFDPIEQTDYYRLFAFLNNQEEPSIKVYDPGVDPAALSLELKDIERQLREQFEQQAESLQAWQAALTDETTKALPADAKKALEVEVDKRNFNHQLSIFAASPLGDTEPFRALRKQRTDLESRLNDVPTTMVLAERTEPRATTVFIKGDFTRPADAVTPGTPPVLHPLETTAERPNRLDLARWIVSPQNPLTARVIANRVWQHYFGRGLVETENDFGMLGTRPSHPELLDWLACELVAQQWSLKDLHRLIVTSHTYQQSSAVRPDLQEQDPQNVWLGRQRRLRLDGELVRDVALTACGLLSSKLGGPPVYPPIPEGVTTQGQSKHAWPVSKGEDRYRRGVYTFMFRATPPPSLNVFDSPDGFSTCTRRNRSNTPLQSLTLMNDAGFFEFAVALEKLVQTDGLELTFRRCTGRTPTADELAVLQHLAPLTAARTLLNLDETITRE